MRTPRQRFKDQDFLSDKWMSRLDIFVGFVWVWILLNVCGMYYGLLWALDKALRAQ